METEKNKKKDSIMMRILKDILFYSVIIGSVLVIRNYVIKPVYVQGESMNPTFYDGETGLSFVPGKDNLDRNEVVIIDTSGYKNGMQYYIIKRVIGLPGEHIKLSGKSIYINGELFKDEYGTFEKDMDSLEVTLGDDEYFCLGDNRSHSSDSRIYGPFKVENIVAHGFWKFPLPNLYGLFRN